jgi:gamma-glutamylcyclotransferase (GGCT)/AIG2-like uncharacterized protein YtfP
MTEIVHEDLGISPIDLVGKQRVFVYGTLKAGGYFYTQALQGSVCVDDNAKLNDGYSLIDLGSYPALVNTTSDVGHTVIGEIFEVDLLTLAHLDMIEGVADGLYNRHWNESVNAWVYVFRTYTHLGAEIPPLCEKEINIIHKLYPGRLCITQTGEISWEIPWSIETVLQ